MVKAKPNRSSAHPPPPGMHLLAMEVRAPWEFGALLPSWPLLQRAAPGDGHAVIVFPGLSASDASTLPLRRYIGSLGYPVKGWEQGFNWGPGPGVLQAAQQQIKRLCDQSGGKVSLVGWSLGGVYARELAKQMAGSVRCVITLGTPFSASPRSTHAWRVYEWVSGRDAHQESASHDLAGAPPVPTTSVYSRSDGIVAWRGSVQAPCARNPHTENIEVFASHIGLGLNPSAWWVVANRLSQVDGQWRRFERTSGWQRLLFPDPQR